MVVHVYNPSFENLRQEDSKFQPGLHSEALSQKEGGGERRKGRRGRERGKEGGRKGKERKGKERCIFTHNFVLHKKSSDLSSN
jgi:hypothetical protein